MYMHRAVFEEAYRILPVGGALSIMDMDPSSKPFVRLANNPIAFAAFRSTEPWLQQYVSFDIVKALLESGFSGIEIASNSPRHRTIVAFKQ